MSGRRQQTSSRSAHVSKLLPVKRRLPLKQRLCRPWIWRQQRGPPRGPSTNLLATFAPSPPLCQGGELDKLAEYVASAGGDIGTGWSARRRLRTTGIRAGAYDTYYVSPDGEVRVCLCLPPSRCSFLSFTLSETESERTRSAKAGASALFALCTRALPHPPSFPSRLLSQPS